MRDSQGGPQAAKSTRAPRHRDGVSAAAPVDRRLTKREQRFVAEYLKDLNGTKAATRAGYSSRTAGVTASKLLTKANVSAALQSGFAERQTRTEVDADRVLRDIDAAANLDMGELFNEAGRLKSIHAMPPHVRRAIISIEVVARRSQGEAGDVEYVHKIKTIDKGRMHELLSPGTSGCMTGLQAYSQTFRPLRHRRTLNRSATEGGGTSVDGVAPAS